MLELENVSYAYDGEVPALRGVSLGIRPGERIAVLGGNGAGKSTFFLCCNGVLRPEQGRVLLDGNPVGRGRKELLALRERVGIVFQDPGQQLIASTVESEVSFGPMNLHLPEEAVRRRVEKALGEMRLAHLRDRPPHALSGGERGRLAIADVLAMEPAVVLFDEPAASLDGAGIAAFEEVLEALHRQDKALLVSTHDTDFAWRWADRALLFHRGELLADDTPARVLADDALRQTTGLRTPALVETARLLTRRGLIAGAAPLPRSLAELEALLAQV